MSNYLKNETSPYLLQHAENPVQWYPWCDEAFRVAKKEDKPIFLSIGYSTCHWCHVMAEESFEDEEIAKILNEHFVSIKVDKEERPDVDNVYMTVCQAFTGSGGWPTSIFMTPDQKPFFAGTYFPKESYAGRAGFKDILMIINEKWNDNRTYLIKQAEEIVFDLGKDRKNAKKPDVDILGEAVKLYEQGYDIKYGGFGLAPKFPSPHNLIFLLNYYDRYKNKACKEMAENTLLQMYRGGIFDHIGFGFCRYSTDKQFLVPHFEKMLYDNALLIMAYCKAYNVTKKEIYLEIAEKIAKYILNEMTSSQGGFYSAQDADSNGKEGEYYVFTPDEIETVLGKKEGKEFCNQFGISEKGNFEGKSIPNLLNSNIDNKSFEVYFPKLVEYRKRRNFLRLDDKILTFWNSLTIAAMCRLYRISKKDIYLNSAIKADEFIKTNLCDDDTLYVSYREGKKGIIGLLDDYAAYIFAQIDLYGATLDSKYLKRAKVLSKKVIEKFSDDRGGFYLYSNDGEKLILRPKETYDGAIPSGNSLMAYNFVKLADFDDEYKVEAQKQLDFLSIDASKYPIGYAMFLTALLDYHNPPMKVTVVTKKGETVKEIPLKCTDDAIIILKEANEEYPLKDNKTTFYICKDHSCLPPTNDIDNPT